MSDEKIENLEDLAYYLSDPEENNQEETKGE
jgi:hypothetical protein